MEEVDYNWRKVKRELEGGEVANDILSLVQNWGLTKPKQYSAYIRTDYIV